MEDEKTLEREAHRARAKPAAKRRPWTRAAFVCDVFADGFGLRDDSSGGTLLFNILHDEHPSPCTGTRCASSSTAVPLP